MNFFTLPDWSAKPAGVGAPASVVNNIFCQKNIKE